MKQSRFWAWLVFAIGAAYFLVPLIATFEFSLRMRRGYYSFDAYASVFADPRFQQTFVYSTVIGIFAIIVGVLVVVPAVYFVRLRMPWLRPYVEFLTLLPLIIPAIILVYGYIRLYNSSSIIPFTGSAT
ncbi:MAG TPA: ABC transporter permease, partial [Devosia sp.]|nr:ABC transporter permease [Devosia sp.]